MIMKLGTLGMIGAVAAFLLPSAAFATIYDAAADFSSSSNPNGVWAYGWSQTLGGTFNTDSANIQNLGGIPGVVQWRGEQPPNADGNPSVFENTTSTTQTVGSISLPAGSLAFHPGSAGQDAVIQFTAPSAGQYLISAIFTGQDFRGPTSTDVNVYVGSTSEFSSVVNGFNPIGTTTLMPTLFTLTSGETVDFIVGDNGGPDGPDAGGANFSFDATGLQAKITAVPEANTIIAGLLLLLPFGAGALRILRNK
jgi:hypothetical protein